MKNQKGIIQVPILIAIITIILIIGGASYYISARQYQSSQSEKLRRDELNALREEVNGLKQQAQSQASQINTQRSQKITNPSEITSIDIQPYLDTVGVLDCFDVINGLVASKQFGTAVLLSEGIVMTNWHVVEGMDTCMFVNDKFYNPKYEISGMTYRSGAYLLDLSNAKRPNANLDFAIVPFSINETGREIAHRNGSPLDEYLEVTELDYRVGKMPRCSEKAQVGIPVAILGYPASSINLEQFAPPESVTTGIISGYQASYESSNYLVSAKVDHGNSGGLALGKEDGKVCLLGIPTWVVTGQLESAGIVQNIHYLLN